MIYLIKHSQKVITDSGGLQKEAYFLQKPCVTLRDETEWIETLDNGWNVLVGTQTEKILQAIEIQPSGSQTRAFGDGHAAQKVVELLRENATKQGSFS